MSDEFEYLTESRIDETTTVVFEFDNVRGRPRFVCAPAGTLNRAYWNAQLKELSSEPRRKGKGGAKKKARTIAEALDMSPAEQAAAELTGRLRDARLIAEHCVKAWDRAPIARVDKTPSGELVPVRCAEFSVQSTRDFLEALATKAPNVFDQFRFWIQSPANFEQMTFEEVEDLAKNSEGGSPGNSVTNG